MLIFESSNGNMHHNQKSHEETGKFGSKGSNCKGRTISSLKSHKKKVSPETHVEMDSRILSALLTVGKSAQSKSIYYVIIFVVFANVCFCLCTNFNSMVMK